MGTELVGSLIGSCTLWLRVTHNPCIVSKPPAPSIVQRSNADKCLSVCPCIVHIVEFSCMLRHRFVPSVFVHTACTSQLLHTKQPVDTMPPNGTSRTRKRGLRPRHRHRYSRHWWDEIDEPTRKFIASLGHCIIVTVLGCYDWNQDESVFCSLWTHIQHM